jgi:hypothetical protein
MTATSDRGTPNGRAISRLVSGMLSLAALSAGKDPEFPSTQSP